RATCVAFEDGRYVLVGTVFAAAGTDRAAVRQATLDALRGLRVESSHELTYSLYDVDPIELVVEAPPIEKLETLAAATKQLAETPGVAHAIAVSGNANGGWPRYFPGDAMIQIYLVPGADRTRLITTLHDRLAANG